MKILYAIQANSNGRICRANEILTYLERMAKVDVLVSGAGAQLPLLHPVKYNCRGMTIDLEKSSGWQFLKSIKQRQTKKILAEINNIPVEQYDLVLNDFEPLTAWACKNKNIPCIGLSHEYAVLGRSSPKPLQHNPFSWLLMHHFAPCTMGIGFHFEAYDIATFTPVIRAEVRHAYLRNFGHYTVYLPHYSDTKIIKVLSKHAGTQWQVFSTKAKKSYAEGNCWVRPVNNHAFISSASCAAGILCNAGFETAAEALFMQKKLLVAPAKNNYTEQCNAAALKQMGVPVLKKISVAKQDKISEWIAGDNTVTVDYRDKTMEALQNIFNVVAVLRETPGNRHFALPLTEINPQLNAGTA
jgi:uncharacterized protein (TIGR00661 family)